MRTLSLLFLFIFSCSAQYAVADSTIPSSKKSQATYERIAPKLTHAMQQKNHRLGDAVFIRIFKKERQLEIWMQNGLSYDLFKTYSICYNSGKLGPKLREGDKQSPEGFYTVGARQLNPNSDYHLSFNLGFPNEYDRSHKRTGSLLMVHGRCSSAGCFAMTDYRMDEIYAIVESAIIAGQRQVPVHIFPFRMTRENMFKHKDSKWLAFWENLKEGFDFFESHHTTPVITVQDKRYHFFTFRPMFFGGEFPPRPRANKYVDFKKRTRRTETL